LKQSPRPSVPEFRFAQPGEFGIIGSMTVTYHYVEQWARGYKSLRRPLTEAQAQARHDSGKWYTVLVGDPLRPSSFIEVVGENKYVGVNFLDAQLRDYLIYDFQRDTSGRLFMRSGTFRRYASDSDTIIAVENYRFSPEGQVTITRTDLRADSQEIGSKEIDVTPNHDTWPEFGRYESLLIRDRDVMQS
jgi:hypothetical protein